MQLIRLLIAFKNLKLFIKTILNNKYSFLNNLSTP